MKKIHSILPFTFIAIISLALLACGNDKSKKETAEHDHDKMEHADEHKMDTDSFMKLSESKSSTSLINNYLAIKNALVQDDSKAASIAGQKLADATTSFDLSSFKGENQNEISEILEVLKEHGEHIAKSEITHQREHFEEMNDDFVDLLAITGIDRTLYLQNCPMYNKNKGGNWLSESSDIKNPLFGSKMLTCGSVKKTISSK